MKTSTPVRCSCGASFESFVEYIKHAGTNRYSTHQKVLEGRELEDWREVQRRVAIKKARGDWQ